MLLFIFASLKNPIPNLNISIHLMLLFIIKKYATPYIKENFNTSHVTVYHSSIKRYGGCIRNFNTSHVTVYLTLQSAIFKALFDFNTSHVTVYQMPGLIRTSTMNISIHLMLLFIH